MTKKKPPELIDGTKVNFDPEFPESMQRELISMLDESLILNPAATKTTIDRMTQWVKEEREKARKNGRKDEPPKR